MSFNRVNPGGWSVNQLLTSAQMNALDIAHTNALDKTGEIQGTGGVIGEIDWLSGSSLIMKSGSTFTIPAGTTSTVSISTGSTFTLTQTATATIDIGNSSAITIIGSGLLTIDNGSTFRAIAGSTLTLFGKISYKTTQLAAAGATYTMDSGLTPDTFLLVDTSTTSKAITLPAVAAGRWVNITDSSGNANTHNVNIIPASGTINGNSSAQLVTAHGTMSLISDGTNWFVVAQV